MLALLAALVLSSPAGWQETEALVGGAVESPDTLIEGALVFHYWPGGERLAVRLAEAAREMPPLPALPAGVVEEGGRVSVFLAPDRERFSDLAGGRAPEWSAGVALPAARVIVLPGYLSEGAPPHRLRAILRHELAHIALHSYLAPQRPPRWFDEGYAQWAAGEWGWEAAWQIRVAFALNRAPPLDSISLDWPRGRADAGIAYLLALTTIAYLTEHGGGEEGLRIFLERWRETGSLESALRRTYGLTVAQFESDWLQEVRSRYGWALLFTHSMVFWAPLAALIVLLTAQRRRRMQRRLEELRANEIPDSPAFWVEGGAEVGDEDSGEGDDKIV